MKKVYFTLFLFLLFTGCARKQSGDKITYTVLQPLPLVIDHPVAVLFTSDHKRIKAITEEDKGSIERILAPLHIPIIASKAENIEFIKNNGDRVNLDLKTMPFNYDVILFNAVNDPVPCYLRDLRMAVKDCFTLRTLVPLNNQKGKDSNHIIPELNADTGTSVLPLNLFHAYGKKGRIIRVPVTDTSAIPFSLRNIPGMRWVENRTDTHSFLKVTFENDLITYANTDRYFTNGIAISLQAPWLGHSGLSQLLLPYRHTSVMTFSLELVQNMYTPKDTRVAPTFIDDRPYASYLYVGYKKIVSDPFRKIRLTNELDIGYLGPDSPGAYLQTFVHKTFPTNDKPIGWATQIKTAVILNYNLKAEKSLVQNRNFMLAVTTSAKAGTLYTRAGAGFRMQDAGYIH